MVVQGHDGKPVVTPQPKNPGVPRMQFNQLVARLELLEARVVELETGAHQPKAGASAKKSGA